LALDSLADGRLERDQRGPRPVLDDSAAIPDGDGSGRRPRVHQLDWDDGWICRTDRNGMADRSNRVVLCRPRRCVGIPASCRRPGLVTETLRKAGLTFGGKSPGVLDVQSTLACLMRKAP